MYPRFSFRIEGDHATIMQAITSFIAKDRTIIDIDVGVAGRMLGFTCSLVEADRMRRYSGVGIGLESGVCRIHIQRCIDGPADDFTFRVMQSYGGESSRHLGKFFLWLMQEFEISNVTDDETGEDLNLLARNNPLGLFDFDDS